MSFLVNAPILSPSLNEYGASTITDENGHVLPVLVALQPDSNGHTGSSIYTIVEGITSQVTGRKDKPQVSLNGGSKAQVIALISVDSSGNPIPFNPSTNPAYRKSFFDTTITSIDNTVGITDTSVARAVGLGAASTFKPGQRVTIKDESGAAGTNSITTTPNGSDTIDGASSNVISTNYGSLRMYTDGVSKWFII